MELMMLGDTIDRIYILHFLQNVKSVIVTLPMSEIDGTLQNVRYIFHEYKPNWLEIMVNSIYYTFMSRKCFWTLIYLCQCMSGE